MDIIHIYVAISKADNAETILFPMFLYPHNTDDLDNYSLELHFILHKLLCHCEKVSIL